MTNVNTHQKGEYNLNQIQDNRVMRRSELISASIQTLRQSYKRAEQLGRVLCVEGNAPLAGDSSGVCGHRHENQATGRPERYGLYHRPHPTVNSNGKKNRAKKIVVIYISYRLVRESFLVQ
jgi:hypothetical protein